MRAVLEGLSRTLIAINPYTGSDSLRQPPLLMLPWMAMLPANHTELSLLELTQAVRSIPHSATTKFVFIALVSFYHSTHTIHATHTLTYLSSLSLSLPLPLPLLLLLLTGCCGDVALV
jgi:hypothetical protein